MKILVVCNNHNSINILRLCLKIRSKLDQNIQITAISPSKDASNDLCNKINSSELNFKVLLRNKIENLENLKKRTSIQTKKSFIRIFKDKLLKHFPKIILNSPLLYKIREIKIILQLKSQKRFILAFMKDHDFNLVLSQSDRTHDYLESNILFAAKSLNIKIILPFLAQYDINAALDYRKDDNGNIYNEYKPFSPPTIYKLVSYFRFRNQLYKNCFFQAPYLLNAHNKNRTLSSFPWWVGNGISDIVCVDSQHSYDKYKKYNVKQNKLRIVGHAQFDEVFISFKNKEIIKGNLLKKYKFSASKKLIILSLPQHAEQGFINWEKHIKGIYDIFEQLERSQSNILVSIHPRQELENYSFLENKFNCIIADENLSSIIGASDIFIASNSSTSTWAVLCGIPGINIVGPIDNLFNHLESIQYVDDINKLSNTLENLIVSEPLNFSNDWKLLSKDEVFDGNFYSRFLQLMLN